MSKYQINIIDGGISIDDRGCVRYVNDFNFKDVKRFYHVENFSKNIIRAFHGHKKEAKYAYVVRGSALICLVNLGKNKKELKKQTVKRFVLSSKKPQILYIPPNHANGFKILENDTSIVYFSNKTLKESTTDDLRLPYDTWGKDIWKTENR